MISTTYDSIKVVGERSDFVLEFYVFGQLLMEDCTLEYQINGGDVLFF